MKKGPIIFVFAIICCLIGAIFFLIQRKWLIVQWTFNTESNEMTLAKKETVLKKDISFFWWKNDKFHHNKATLIWRRDKNADNIKQVINNWLNHLKGEKLLEPVIAIDSVVLSQSEQEAYFSFNQAFSWKEWSIFKKWMLLEGLCKTIKSTGLPIKYITVWANHEPMPDEHLDFTHAWSVDGFVEE